VDVDGVVDVGDEPPALDLAERDVRDRGGRVERGAVDRPAGVGPQRPRSNWNVRSVGPGTSTSCSASRSGTALSSRAERMTRKRITSAAEPSPSALTMVTSVPTGTRAKSTTTSNRSPGAASTLGARPAPRADRCPSRSA
jgi:hypothetical protein